MYFFIHFSLLTQEFSHVNLTVKIEEKNEPTFDMVDEVHIPITMNSYSESEQYLGVHEIAAITLGYSFIIITDIDNSDTTQKGEHFLRLYIFKHVHFRCTQLLYELLLSSTCTFRGRCNKHLCMQRTITHILTICLSH